jgi:conjugal transfer mating pair stabilization protein TraG
VLFPISASLIAPIPERLKFGALRTTTDPPHTHKGVDLAWGKVGAPVFASAPGKVTASNAIPGLGGPWGVYIEHEGGWQTRYLHLADDGSAIAKGSYVRAGEQIGTIGKLSSGPHLHFEVWKDGKPLDPESVLSKNGGFLLVALLAGLVAFYVWRKW